MADLGPTSPLAVMSAAFSEACAQSDGVLGIQERPFAAQVTLRIDPDSATGLAVADALSLRLPVSPCTVAGGESLEALWLGPDEWLLVSFEQTAGAIERTVRSVTARGTDDPVAVVDVSAQRTIVELSGPAVRTVLARGCALDLHESVFSAGCCAQTLLAQAPVILQPTDTDTVRIFVRASFASYLAAWLLDAGAEERTGAGRPITGELALPAR